jgi:hypothetical protein
MLHGAAVLDGELLKQTQEAVESREYRTRQRRKLGERRDMWGIRE